MRAVIAKIIILITAIVSIVIVVCGFRLMDNSKDLSANVNNKTNGTVIAIICGKYGGDCAMIITYTDNSGNNHTLSDFSRDDSDKVGDIVTVSYRKDDPRNAARNENDYVVHNQGAHLVAFGIAGILTVLVVICVMRSYQIGPFA